MTFLTEFDTCKKGRQQFGVVPRLGDEIRSTALQRTHRLISIGVCRHQDYHRLCIAMQDVLQQLEALLATDSITPEVHIQQGARP